VAALEGMLEVALVLLDEAARAPAAPHGAIACAGDAEASPARSCASSMRINTAREQSLLVEVEGAARPAIADVGLVGRAQVGDELIVKRAGARPGAWARAALTSCTRTSLAGLDGGQANDAHVMKLNYTSLQHAVHPVEDQRLRFAAGQSGSRCSRLHGQLAARRVGVRAPPAPARRLGYVQTAGGALPGRPLANGGASLRERGLPRGAPHGWCGPSAGSRRRSAPRVRCITDCGRWGGMRRCGGPGPRDRGLELAARARRDGGARLRPLRAWPLGCPTLVVARMSSGDARAHATRGALPPHADSARAAAGGCHGGPCRRA